MTTLRPWQRRLQRFMESLLAREDVRLELEEIIKRPVVSDEDATLRVMDMRDFIVKYKIPNGLDYPLYAVLKTGVLDYKTIRTPISVISEIDETVTPGNKDFNRWFDHHPVDANLKLSRKATYIVMSPTVTRQELEQFIADHWKSAIEPKLKLHGKERGPIRMPTYPERDAEIFKMHLNGLTAPQISRELEVGGYSMEPAHIRKVIQREKARRDT